jgi:hypothetical protein
MVMLWWWWERLHRMLLVEVLLWLRMTAMRRELYGYVASGVVDVCKARKALQVQLQLVVGPTAFPAVLLILKVC